MGTLIAVYDSYGCAGRCDARCYDAQGPDCKCICGGANHGVGEKIARKYSRYITDDELTAECQKLVSSGPLRVFRERRQLEMFS